jgi:hypothetical protein
VYHRATFVLGWSNMWKALSCSPRWPSLTGRLLLDLLNEPDELGMAWEAKGTKPALAGGRMVPGGMALACVAGCDLDVIWM